MEFLIGFLVIIFLLLSLRSSQKGSHRKHYGIKSTTYKGEHVKSRGEKQIADYLQRNGVKYLYEPGIQGIYADPDFYLPDHRVYVEYWGLVDADDTYTKNKYVKSMKRKMALYHKNRIKFISIYPKNLNNLDWIFKKKFEDVTGHQLH